MAELTARQRRAIRGILSTSTLAEAAKFAHVGERSINRYLADADFRAALRAEQDRLTSHLAAALSGQAADALATLERLHKDGQIAPSVRRAAARDIIAERRKAAELDSLAERVEALEERLK